MSDFVLEPPTPLKAKEAPAVIPPEAALAKTAELVPVQAKTANQQKVQAFVGNLTALKPNSPEFEAKVATIMKVGDKEMASTATISNRMLERPMVQQGAQSPQMKVAGTLQELREQAEKLDPSTLEDKGLRRVFKSLPGSDRMKAWAHRFDTAKQHMDAIELSLLNGQEALQRDNADIQAYQEALWEDLGRLGEFNDLLDAMKAYVEDLVVQARAQGNSELASALESDALFRINQRRADIQTQITVATQGYMALNLVKSNNDELIRGVDRARQTTMMALQISLTVAQALEVQGVVLKNIQGLNATTGNIIEATSERLKLQGAEVQKQAASAMISPEVLSKAYQNILDAVDDLDAFRAAANENLDAAVTALRQQQEEARPYLEKAAQKALGA